jgi:ribonuclease P protein component
MHADSFVFLCNKLKKQNSLPAQERIKSRMLFEELTNNGIVLKQYPFRMIWCPIPFNNLHPVQIAVTVSKRNIPDAAGRNRTKRVMRESYRLNKHALVEWARMNQKGLAILFTAQVKTPPDFHQTQEKIILLLQRLMLKNAVADQ